MGSATQQKLKLMVVDDEPDNLDLLYRTFRQEFKVYTARSGLEALAGLEEAGEMAIIISDQRMPKMNGTEFLSRTVERFPDTIRIVLTGYTDVEDLVEAINSGKVFKYITKPWNPEKLKEVVLQAAETYRVVKQRTHTLANSLRRESLINEVMRAVRESLDYGSMLQTVVNTLEKTFEADFALLQPWEGTDPAPEVDPLFHPGQVEDNSVNELPSTLLSESKSFFYGEGTQIILATERGTGLEPPSLSMLQARHQQHSKVSSMEGQAILDLSPRNTPGLTCLTIPLIYQQRCLVVTSLFKRGNGVWSTETLDLVESISDQLALALAQAKLYQQVQEQTRQMRAELEVARQIQMNLLRQAWPDLEGLRIQARCLPAREVGGDFFEVYVHPQGDVWLAVGDVSGKGVPAALFMASAISVLRRELSQEISPTPETVMQNLNGSLMDDLVSNNCFITLILVRYSPATRSLAYANAGHVYPLVWSAAATGAGKTADRAAAQPYYLEARGIPLGILPTWRGQSGKATLSAGQALLLTSDGLTEATLRQVGNVGRGEMLKQEGLWDIVKQQPAPLDLDKLLATIQVLSIQQDDDQTVLSLEVQG